MKNQFKYISLFIVTLVISSGTANAHFLKGSGSYNTRDHATVLGEWRPIPDLGLAKAQIILGLIHGSSEDVTKNNLETVKRYRSAVKQGLSRKEQTEYIKGKAREAKRRREAREAAREAAGEEPPFLDDSTKKSLTRTFVKGLVPILLFSALGGLIWLIKFIYRKIF